MASAAAARAALTGGGGGGVARISNHNASSHGIVRLTVTGDVMLGRGIDMMNRVHCHPRIYESFCRDAHDYVRLARRRYGYPPLRNPAADVDNPARVWGDLLGDLRGDDDEDHGVVRVGDTTSNKNDNDNDYTRCSNDEGGGGGALLRSSPRTQLAPPPPLPPRLLLMNLETAVTAGGQPWPGKGINYRKALSIKLSN